MTDLLPCREAFEKWADGEGYDRSKYTAPYEGQYKSEQTACGYKAWQAAYESRTPPIPSWQPIETAPKDDSLIIGCWMPKGKRKIVHYAGDNTGWWSGDFQVHEPTHWMPLPQPPLSISEGK